jgi:transcriptional regulator with XRE-family HTH domain
MKRTAKSTQQRSKKAIKKISPLDWYVIHAIKKLRMERGLTQADLSFKLNFSDSFIAQMESDQTPAHYNISHLNAIARVLKCSIHDFFPKHPLPEEVDT